MLPSLVKMEKEIVFSTFRPFCAALATKPSKEILEKLSELVSKSDPRQLEMLQEYIIFPCQLYLKTPVMQENFTIQVLRFVEEFFSHQVELNSTFVMNDLLQSIFQLSNEEKSSKSDLSEDLKIGICDCLSQLFQSSNGEVKATLYSEEQKLLMSHLVFQVLEWSQSDVRQVNMSCLNLIDSLCIDRQGLTYNIFLL